MKATFLTVAAGAGAITAIVAAYYTLQPIAQSVILENSDPPPLAAASRVEALEEMLPPMQRVLTGVEQTLLESQIDTIQRRVDCAPEGTEQGDRLARIQELQQRHRAIAGDDYEPIRGGC